MAEKLSTVNFFDFLIFQTGKNPAKKFSARKKGVSYPSDCRIIIRLSDVQLTIIILLRRDFSGSPGFCTKNPDRPDAQHILASKKIRILVFVPEFFFARELSRQKNSGNPDFRARKTHGLC